MLDPQNYRDAVNKTGPLAYDWDDKPHRLVYDLCKEMDRLQAALTKIAKAYPCSTAEAMSRVAAEALGQA